MGTTTSSPARGLPRPRVSTLLSAAAWALGLLALGSHGRPAVAARDNPTSGATPAIAELWEEPEDLGSRDLFLGPGGASLAIAEGQAFRLQEREAEGFSGGYDVLDANGRAWDVKVGPEAQTEVVASRVLWALGYRQLPTYYVTRWRLDPPDAAGPPPGRFRPEWGRRIEGTWSWKENPFAGSPALRTLLVANVLLNNWDLKTSNNLVYRLDAPVAGVDRWFVVQDLGATFGRTGAVPPGTRNDVEGFEKEGYRFVRFEGPRLRFTYDGKQRDLLDDLTPGDVAAACRLLARLSDHQWTEAFRAGGFDPATARRLLTVVQRKIAIGVELAPREGA